MENDAPFSHIHGGVHLLNLWRGLMNVKGGRKFLCGLGVSNNFSYSTQYT